jgi:hypothetical protein
VATSISGEQIFNETAPSPQFEAFDWIVNLDSRFLCPESETLRQRFSMAVFYYSTRGDRWTQCRAPSNFADPDLEAQANADCGLAGDAWLTSGSECDWAFVTCNDEGWVAEIAIGT